MENKKRNVIIYLSKVVHWPKMRRSLRKTAQRRLNWGVSSIQIFHMQPREFIKNIYVKQCRLPKSSSHPWSSNVQVLRFQRRQSQPARLHAWPFDLANSDMFASQQQ